MKIKVTLLLTVLSMLMFSGTAYADSYDSTTQTVVIDTAWEPNTLETIVETLIAPNLNIDVLHLTIVAGNVTILDSNYIDNQLTSLQTLIVTAPATFQDTGSTFFRNDAAILSIEIPSITIGNNFAHNCANLTTVIVPNAIYLGNSCIRNNQLLTTVDLTSAEYFGNGCLRNNDVLQTLELPSAIEVGNNFGRSSDLTLVEAPLMTIFGNSAFTNNDSLTSLTLESAEQFGDNAVSGCAILTDVNMPSATTFGIRAFQNSDALTKVYLPMLQTFGIFAFNGVLNAIDIELAVTTPTGILTTTFSAYDPQVMGAVVSVPIQAVEDYDDADGTPDDGLWYGWTIFGIVPEPAVNPQTGDNSTNIPYTTLIIMILGVGSIYTAVKVKKAIV